MKKICRISSRAGNPLGLGRCKCVMVWLQIPLGPLDPWRLCSNGLAATALCFWYNDFCVGFCCETLGIKVCECIWKPPMCSMLSSDMCSNTGWVGRRTLSQSREVSSSGQGTPAMGNGPVHRVVVHQPWTWGGLSAWPLFAALGRSPSGLRTSILFFVWTFLSFTRH